MVVYGIEGEVTNSKLRKRFEDIVVVDLGKIKADWLAVRRLSDEVRKFCKL